MAMNTPIGNITQITPISSFVTLQSIALDQYLLGINNFVQGDGSKVTLQNLIASMVNTTNDKNILGLDENGRLQAIEAVNPFGNDNGWAVAPTLTVNWTNRTVSGTGGKAYKDGFEITALSNFTSPAFPAEVGAYYLYYNGTNLVWQSGSKPDSKYLIAKISVDSNDIKMAADAWGVGGVNETISNFLNAALGTIVLNGGEIGNVTTDVEITEGNYLQPTLTATTIGMADFSKLIPALPSGSYTRVHTANNQLVYETAQSGIVPTHSGNIPIIIDNAGNENDIALECCTNVWVVGLPLFGENPADLHYQFVTGSVQYEGINDAKAASPMAEIAMQYIDNQYDRYAIIARFTIQRTENGYMCIDYENYNPLQGGGGAGSTGITEVVSDSKYFDGLGLPSSPLTMSEETKDILNNVIHDKENIYKVIEGHKSHDGKLWDLIEYHDATDKDNLLVGGDEVLTSNSSSEKFHSYLLDPINCPTAPDATAKLNIWQIFNRNAWETTRPSIYVNDGTIVIAFNKKTRISKIEMRSTDDYYKVPSTIYISGANINNNMGREITMADYASSKYIGGMNVTKENAYNNRTWVNGRSGLNRPIYLNMNKKDYYNTFFIALGDWCGGENGSGNRLSGIRVWGSQEETEDGDLTAGSDKLLQVLGDYDVKMSGKGFNKSAFAVVGNPTITREGILNQATPSNCVTTNTLTLSNNNDIDIEMKVYLLGDHCYVFGGSNGTRFEPYNIATNGHPAWSVLSFAEQFAMAITEVLPENQWITIRFHYRGTNSYAEILENGSFRNLSTIIIVNGSFSINEPFHIGAFQGMSSNCNIDLKHFPITIDGKTVVDGGIDYEDCKWISSNGTVYNTKDLIEQYGKIPQERVELDRWVSCFGCGMRQSATARVTDQYYPCFVQGTFSCTDNATSAGNWGSLRQTNYCAEPRIQVGYNVLNIGYADHTPAINTNIVWDYTADDLFPAGEYYWEGIFGYNADPTNKNVRDSHIPNWVQILKVFEDNTTEIIQTFCKNGSMYDHNVCYRSPRFYADKPFKKFRIISKQSHFPNSNNILNQTQLYYRKPNEGDLERSFTPSPTDFDVSYNCVKHKSNLHFFITPTGVRVGSNCFVDKIDPKPIQACVGNRWINENTRLSYVCNESGKWEREDFCEIGIMTLFGTEHKGMLLRSVANFENPITKYVQEYGALGGNLAFNDELVANASTIIQTSENEPDFYFQAEGKDDNNSIKFFMPVQTTVLSASRRQLVTSQIYEGGEQYCHYSNAHHCGARFIAYKTWETGVSSEYIEGSEEI